MDYSHERRSELPDAEEKQLPKWPLQLALSVVFVIEFLFVVMLSAEGVAGNILMVANSVGILVFCVLTWRGIPWSRWLLIAFLVWRVARIGIDMSSHFGPSDHRLGGSVMLVTLYVVAGALAASPLGRSKKRVAP